MEVTDLGDVIETIRSVGSTPTAACLYARDEAGERRTRNLTRYLQAMATTRPKVALIGEAPGHRGSRLTGVPFVSERQALDPESDFRQLFDFDVELAASEVAASDEVTSNVMWRVLRASGEQPPLLWSACSRHPHQEHAPGSNRTPTPSEVREHAVELQMVLDYFGIRNVIAVGGVASRALTLAGIAHDRVRHPARGGAHEFHHGVTQRLTKGRSDTYG